MWHFPAEVNNTYKDKTLFYANVGYLPKDKGRAVIYKPVQLPVDLIEDLKMYKDAYGMVFAEEEDEWGNPIPVHVSYEQMSRRWMDNVKKFDKDVQKGKHPTNHV